MALSVEIKKVSSPEIVYKRGTVYQTLNGFHASLYQQMIWQYGEAEATERFWWLWHKRKEA